MIVAHGGCYELQKGYCRDITAYSALAIISELSEVNDYLNLVTIESYERSREPIKMERA